MATYRHGTSPQSPYSNFCRHSTVWHRCKWWGVVCRRPLPLTWWRTTKHKWHRRTLPPSSPFFLLLAPSSTQPATPHVPFHSRTTYWHTQLKQVQPFTWKYIFHSVSLQLPSTVTVEDWGPSSKWPTFLVPQQCVDSIPGYFPIKLAVKHAPAGSSQADWISVSNAFEN